MLTSSHVALFSDHSPVPTLDLKLEFEFAHSIDIAADVPGISAFGAHLGAVDRVIGKP
jgi:hypothetical protein